jgi:hypothetical protein
MRRQTITVITQSDLRAAEAKGAASAINRCKSILGHLAQRYPNDAYIKEQQAELKKRLAELEERSSNAEREDEPVPFRLLLNLPNLGR